MENGKLYNKILGTLVGGSIGDAYGIRLEMMHYLDIQEQYGKVEHFGPLAPRKPSSRSPLELYYPFARDNFKEKFHPLGRWSHEVGAYTDDMRYRFITYRAFLRKGGPITGKDLAEEWLNYRLMAAGASEYMDTYSWEGPQNVYAKYTASLDRLVGMATKQRPCTPGWDSPFGVIHAGDPAAAAGIGHSIAIAVATAMMDGATIDTVIDQVLRRTDCYGPMGREFKGRLEKMLDIASHCEDVFAFFEPFYKEMLVTFPPFDAVFPLEMTPCALALCYIAKGDGGQAVIGGANIGRDADSIASITGEVMGALYGPECFPQEWVDQVLRLNPEPDMKQLSSELSGLVTDCINERRSQEAKVLPAG